MSIPRGLAGIKISGIGGAPFLDEICGRGRRSWSQAHAGPGAGRKEEGRRREKSEKKKQRRTPLRAVPASLPPAEQNGKSGGQDSGDRRQGVRLTAPAHTSVGVRGPAESQMTKAARMGAPILHAAQALPARTRVPVVGWERFRRPWPGGVLLFRLSGTEKTGRKAGRDF